MAVHLDIVTLDYSVQNTVKIGGNVVNIAYFTRNIIKIAPSPTNGFLVAMLPWDATYVLTDDQASTSEEVYIIDTVDRVAPTSLLDLAAKLNAIIKY